VEKRSLDAQDLLDFSKTYRTKVVPIHFHVIYANESEFYFSSFLILDSEEEEKVKRKRR